MENETQVLRVEGKSIGLAFLLALLFGPLGMLYATVPGALVMLVISAVVAFFTAGFGLIVTWPICILWACIAAGNTKTRVVRPATQY